MGYLRRQAIVAALTANALRPLRGPRSGIPSFAAGWFTGELAPQLLAASAADTALQLARGRGRRSKLGLALAAASGAGLAHLVRQSMQVKGRVEDALVEGLGVDYVEQLDVPPSPADLATPWRNIARPFHFRAEGVRRISNIAYTDAGRRGMLDIYLPDGDDAIEKAPVLLQVHGGAWILGSKNDQGLPLMTHMASKGWVCVSINYRLAPRNQWPAHIVDVKRAIAWVKEHIAEYGGDPDYLAITGGSAGGHLAALAALTPHDRSFQPGFEDVDTSVRAAVPFYGYYDFAGSTGARNAEIVRDTFLAPRVVGARWADDPDLFEAASPILRVTADAPDFFVIHGVGDSLVPVAHAHALVAELRRTSKASVVYAELPGAQHAFDVFHSIRGAHVVRAVDRYLNWHWNSWRRGLAPDEDAAQEALAGEDADNAEGVEADRG